MDVVLLSRIQFALTAGFHFLFPPLTIGMASIIFIMQTLSWKIKSEASEKMQAFSSFLLAYICKKFEEQMFKTVDPGIDKDIKIFN